MKFPLLQVRDAGRGNPEHRFCQGPHNCSRNEDGNEEQGSNIQVPELNERHIILRGLQVGVPFRCNHVLDPVCKRNRSAPTHKQGPQATKKKKRPKHRRIDICHLQSEVISWNNSFSVTTLTRRDVSAEEERC